MNSIRALNVRTEIDANLRSRPYPGPDIRAAKSGIAPIKPAGQQAAEAPVETLDAADVNFS